MHRLNVHVCKLLGAKKCYKILMILLLRLTKHIQKRQISTQHVIYTGVNGLDDDEKEQ